VNYASKRNDIIVDASKLSPSLGVKWSVPVEVVAFGQRSTAGHLRAFGDPVLRLREGVPFRTDSGNVIYDVACGPISDAPGLDRSLRAVPGVVETGLFIRRADLVLVAGEDGVRRLTPRPASI
jgi:ribose 5-phosphate isomerase A